MQRQTHVRQPSPRGFTLLEVLITVSIIAVLASFLTMAIGRAITQAREAATRATLLKLDGLLQQRLEAFRTLMDSPQRQNELKGRISAKKTELKNGSPSLLIPNEKLLQIMLYKDYYRAGFPQTLADNAGLSNAGQFFAADFPNASGVTPNAQVQNGAESSEMLHWLLTQADTFGVPAVDDSEFSSAEIGDTDGDGRMEFLDAWGVPLRFYRWPTRLLRPSGPVPVGSSLGVTPAGRQLAGILILGLPAAPPANTGDADPLAIDPDDRLGIFLSTASQRQAEQVITPTQFENLYHTPDTYHIPLIVSAGPDKSTGLNEPYDTSSGMGRLAGATATALADPRNSELNDNLTNRQKQQK